MDLGLISIIRAALIPVSFETFFPNFNIYKQTFLNCATAFEQNATTLIYLILRVGKGTKDRLGPC